MNLSNSDRYIANTFQNQPHCHNCGEMMNSSSLNDEGLCEDCARSLVTDEDSMNADPT